MNDHESKHDKVLKRFQLWVAVLAGIITLSIGLYNAKNLFLTEKRPGNLALEVRAEDGRGASGASVEIMRAQGAVVVSSKTDAQGNYDRSELEPGNYTVKVSKAGFESETVFFTVEPGRTAELEIKLKPASSAIRNTVEEIGASWIKALASPKTKSEENTQVEAVPAQ